MQCLLVQLLYLLSNSYTLEKTEHPNLDGVIKFVKMNLFESTSWIEYEGVTEISMDKVIIYSKDKRKSFPMQVKNDYNIIPTSKDGINSLVTINGREYINISEILNYLGYNNYKVYTDVEKGFNVFEILE